MNLKSLPVYISVYIKFIYIYILYIYIERYVCAYFFIYIIYTIFTHHIIYTPIIYPIYCLLIYSFCLDTCMPAYVLYHFFPSVCFHAGSIL